MSVWQLSADEDSDAGLLDNVKTVFDIVGTTFTVVALITGGVWAYYKFIKGRTFRPRIDVTPSAEWLAIDGVPNLLVRVTIKNLGASAATLIHEGSGIRLSRLAAQQRATPAVKKWEKGPTIPLLKHHHWIEPGEQVTDEVLVDLGLQQSAPLLLHARFVWGSGKKRIAVHSRRVFVA